MSKTKAWGDISSDEEDDLELFRKDDQQEDGRTLLYVDNQTGIETYLSYGENEKGEPIKILTKLRKVTVKKKTNKFVEERKKWRSFGKTFDASENQETKNNPVRQDEETFLELSGDRKLKNIGEQFYEDSIARCDGILSLAVSKKYDPEAVRRQKEAEAAIAAAREEEMQINAAANQAASNAVANQMANRNNTDSGAPGRYVPPSQRMAGNRGGGQGMDDQNNEFTLRVTNLSEDVKEGDLQALFMPFGNVRRVFLAKFREGGKEGLSKGYAFVTYKDKSSGEKAITTLNGHGYDNLILQVSWAKQREDP